MIRQSIRYNRRFPLFNHVIHLLRVALSRKRIRIRLFSSKVHRRKHSFKKEKNLVAITNTLITFYNLKII